MARIFILLKLFNLLIFFTFAVLVGLISQPLAFADSDDDQHEGKVNKKNRVWTGDGPPLPKLGKVGDLYIDNHNGSYNIYKKTSKNTWTDVIDIQGTPGSQGLTSLILTSVEPTGPNCAAGGVKIMTGVDDNDDGSLAVSEVDATNYVCNGIAGPQGLPGSFGDLNAKIADKNSEISNLQTQITSLQTTLIPLQTQLNALEVQLEVCLSQCQMQLSTLNYALAFCISGYGGYLPDGSVPTVCLDEKAAVDNFICDCSSSQAEIDAQLTIIEPLENQLATLNSELSLCQIDLQTLESLERLFGTD